MALIVATLVLPVLLHPIIMLGTLVSAVFFGLISDRLERLTALMISMIFIVLSGLFCALIPTLGRYEFIRVIAGMGHMGCFMVIFVIAVEYVWFKYTMLIAIVIVIPFGLGVIILEIETYYIRDWYTLQLVDYVPWAVLVGLWFIIPESPRWLIDVRKYDRVITILYKKAKVNNCKVPKELLDVTSASNKIEGYHELESTNQDTPSFKDLFASKSMALRTLNMFYQWFAVTMCYCELTISSTSLEDDPLKNYLLGVAIEISPYIFCILAMDCWGDVQYYSFVKHFLEFLALLMDFCLI